MSEKKIDATRLLYNFVQAAPGFESGNYDSRKSYAADIRRVNRQKADFFVLLQAAQQAFAKIEDLDKALLESAPTTFSGRLAFLPATEKQTAQIEYTAGQYECVEYRAAACAIVADALWNHYRDEFAAKKRDGETEGDAIRRYFRALVGSRVAGRWLS